MSNPSSPRRILFVCTGNICRSAMADHLLRFWSEKRGLGLEVRSCGTAAESWYEMPEHAHRLLTAEGLPAIEHQPKLLTRDLLRWADTVLVMAEHHREHICERYPEFTAKTRLLRAAADLDNEDVADPMGQSYEVFSACLGVIRQSLEALLRSNFGMGHAPS